MASHCDCGLEKKKKKLGIRHTKNKWKCDRKRHGRGNVLIFVVATKWGSCICLWQSSREAAEPSLSGNGTASGWNHGFVYFCLFCLAVWWRQTSGFCFLVSCYFKNVTKICTYAISRPNSVVAQCNAGKRRNKNKNKCEEQKRWTFGLACLSIIVVDIKKREIKMRRHQRSKLRFIAGK